VTDAGKGHVESMIKEVLWQTSETEGTGGPCAAISLNRRKEPGKAMESVIPGKISQTAEREADQKNSRH